MNRFEILLDVLEANGFPNLREEMQRRDDELMSDATLRNVLTTEEIKAVKRVLKEFKVPSPTGWAHAMYVGSMKMDVERFSPDNVYDYTELCNLSTTLHEAGLSDPEIWRKLEAAKNLLKRYK